MNQPILQLAATTAIAHRQRRPVIAMSALHRVSGLICLLILWLLTAQSTIAVTIGFPINAQLPPVARIGEKFEFKIVPNTFVSVVGNLRVDAHNLPSWLHFDAQQRVLSGTPQEKDVGDFTWTLIAQDDTNIATSPTVFIVTKNPAPSTPQSMDKILAQFYPTDGNSAIIMKENQEFKITFPADVFMESGTAQDHISYYGVSDNFSPLPDWVHFDAESRTFLGKTPSINSQSAPPQRFSFEYAASEFKGFRSAWIPFYIAVGLHSFKIEQTTFDVRAAKSGFSFKVPLDKITLDGNKVQRNQIVSATSSAKDWLKFDGSSLTLSQRDGSTPSSETVTIDLVDIYQNSLRLTVNIKSDTSERDSLLSTISDVSVNPGDQINVQLQNFILDHNAKISVSIDQGGSWITFDESTKTLKGTAPLNPRSNTVPVIVNAQDRSKKQSRKFMVNIANVQRTSAPTASATATSSATRTTLVTQTKTPTATQTEKADETVVADQSRKKSNRGLAIGLGIGIPLGLVLIASIIAIFCCRRRRSRGDFGSPKSGGPSDHPEISRPIAEEKDLWPIDNDSWGLPRRLSALKIVKDKSDHSGLSGYIAEIRQVENESRYTTAAYSFDGRQVSSIRSELNSADQHARRRQQNDTIPAAIVRESWRNSEADVWQSNERASDASLATVATNDIFTVRLVSQISPEESEERHKSEERPPLPEASQSFDAPGLPETSADATDKYSLSSQQQTQAGTGALSDADRQTWNSDSLSTVEPEQNQVHRFSKVAEQYEEGDEIPEWNRTRSNVQQRQTSEGTDVNNSSTTISEKTGDEDDIRSNLWTDSTGSESRRLSASSDNSDLHRAFI